MMHKWLIGIDEAGRGPLAGPVAVGVVLVALDFDWGLIPGVNDSKKLSPEKREALFRRARTLKQEGQLSYAVSMTSAKTIDRIGIVSSVSLALNRALLKAVTNSTIVKRPNNTVNRTITNATDYHDFFVKLDGGLKAPPEYVHQETIIKGDALEPSIGLASIMAKVTRDRYMERVGKLPLYAVYGLPVHKGYGTKTHRSAIKKHGCTDLHRLTYCKNIWPG